MNQHIACLPRRRAVKASLLLCAGLAANTWAQAGFDHQYAGWDNLLKKHVKWLADGKQSRVDYKGFLADRAALKGVLDQLSGVSKAQFGGWAKPEQMAFLINAYNAFTVELILTKYPDLKSIKDLGSFVQGPWKRKFFSLLGQEQHLDWIEHDMLRPTYADPRIHAAIVCASIGCPALRTEAFTAQKLEAQLEDGMQRFLADRTRNRMRDGKLEVSHIFKWFKEDFERGHKGFGKLEDVWAKHAKDLSDSADDQAKLRSKAPLAVTHLPYDWSLNDSGR
jgi:hypothetical protein